MLYLLSCAYSIRFSICDLSMDRVIFSGAYLWAILCLAFWRAILGNFSKICPEIVLLAYTVAIRATNVWTFIHISKHTPSFLGMIQWQCDLLVGGLLYPVSFLTLCPAVSASCRFVIMSSINMFNTKCPVSWDMPVMRC